MAIKVAIVGSTGLVGQEMEKILNERFKRGGVELLRFASRERPAEGVLDFAAHRMRLAECPYILNASNEEIALEIERDLKPGQVLIDNSSAFRLDARFPLVVPEVNDHMLRPRPRVVANPNCTTILLTLALKPLASFGLHRVIVSTYQAASGAGIRALEELRGQMRALGRDEALPAPEVFAFPLANNVMSHNSRVVPSGEGAGYNGEEWKVMQETRKILGQPELAISATCARVPVERAHTEAVTIDLLRAPTEAQLREIFAAAPGVRVVDDRVANHFPMPLESQNQDLVLVGRLRRDPFLPSTVHLFLSGDQIRKGAATNAVQILQALEA